MVIKAQHSQCPPASQLPENELLCLCCDIRQYLAKEAAVSSPAPLFEKFRDFQLEVLGAAAQKRRRTLKKDDGHGTVSPGSHLCSLHWKQLKKDGDAETKMLSHSFECGEPA